MVGRMANHPLADLLEGALRRYPHGVAGPGGPSADPRDLARRADRLAEELRARGLTPDEPVMVMIRTEPGDLAAFLAVWRAGGVAVPVHAAAAPVTLAGVEGQTGARFRLRDGGLEETGASAPPKQRPLLQGAALVIFTSGSTGQPKGVVIGHERFARKIEVLGRLLRPEPSDHVVVPLQLTFIFGLWVTFVALAAGSRLTLVSRFSADGLAREFADGATILAAVPSMLRTILSGPPLPAPALKTILTGGEALGPALATRIAAAYPSTGIYDLYGSTETGSCDFCLGPEDLPEGIGAIGSPTEGVGYRIAGGTGPVEPGETGEVQIASPFGMLGYLDRPDLTAASFVDGYFRTGDLGRLRPDGRVELVGRSKEIISRGGNKIAPLELDNLIASHPEVTAALCAGVPDARLGEAIHAVVVPKAGAKVAPDALRAWLADRIERFKLPDVIEIADTLPTGATGKASRTALTERVVAQRRG